MDLRSPTSLLSPTCPNSSNSDGPPKSMLTLYWPTAITVAKPHVLSNNSPSSSSNDSQRCSKWLLGWNPRGLVVVVGAVLEVPTLSACQSVLEELHRNPPLGCDQSVIKYLRILGRLDADDESAHDEEDAIQTNRLKNSEDIWVELASVASPSSPPLSPPSNNGVENKGSRTPQYTHVSVSDLHCCGYRQPVSLVAVRYDPREQYPTGTYTTTPLASVGSIMSQAATDGTSAKLANMVLAPGARSRLEGQYVDPIVRQLCAPQHSVGAGGQGKTTTNRASNTNNTMGNSRNSQNNPMSSNSRGGEGGKDDTASGGRNGADAVNLSTAKNQSTSTASPTNALVTSSSTAGLFASGTQSASVYSSSIKTPSKQKKRGDGAATGDEDGSADARPLAFLDSSRDAPTTVTSPSPSVKTSTTVPMQRSPQRIHLHRNLSNDHISAMAAEMLQQEQEQAVSKTSPLLFSAQTPHGTPQRRAVGGMLSTGKAGGGGGGGSASNAAPPPFHLGPDMSLAGSFGPSASAAVGDTSSKTRNRGNTLTSSFNNFDIKTTISAADAATNDSFSSNHSFRGQVPSSYLHNAAAANSGANPLSDGAAGSSAPLFSDNNAPRLRYDTYESFTEFSVILKCCNASSKITESLFDMEETLAEAEEGHTALSPSLSSLLADSRGGGGDHGQTNDSSLPPCHDPVTPRSAASTKLGIGTVDNSSLVTPQSSMRRRRRTHEEEGTAPTDEEVVGMTQSQRSGSSGIGGRRFPRRAPLDDSVLSMSRSGKATQKQQSASEVIHGLAVAAESLLVPFILTVLLPFLAYVRDYSYVMRVVEYRAMEVVNALSIIAGKSTACGLHPTVPHALEGTTANQRFWCVARCFLQIGVDMALGWIVSLWLINFQEDFLAVVRPSAWYGLHDMHIRYLDWFEGWPGGFKMNDDLNLFISFFTRLCLGIWQSIVVYNTQWDWLSIAMSGLRFMCFFGLSFGLNFVSDCCNIATLHLRNAFHILRVVYVWFGSVIRSLTLQFRGKRVNPLRRRVDDFEFENDQTVIGMLMCTCVIFLFPTMALHYFYLAIVRTSVWFVQEFFCALGFIVGNLPLASFIFWFLHKKEVVKGLTVTNIQVDGVSGTVEMTLVAKHMQLSEAFIDWLTLIRVVTSPLQPQKLLSFIISATLKPAINARNSVYPHLYADCVSPCLGSLAGQTSQSS